MTQNQPMIIDMDVVRELRLRGKREEAAKLLQSYYASKNKSKKEVIADWRKRQNVIRKYKHLCTGCGKLNDTTLTIQCSTCREKRRIYYQKRKEVAQ